MNEPVSVIINVYNEAAVIEQDVRALQAQIIDKLSGSQFLIAEDGSTDGTSEIVAGLAAELGATHLTSKERKGYVKAFRDAVEAADNPYVFFADVGGKFDYGDFWNLYEVREGADLVIGRRVKRQDQVYRRILTACYNALLRAYFGTRLPDADSGFRLYRREALAQVAAQDWVGRDLIGSEIALRIEAMGGRVVEAPVRYFQRVGVSRGMPPGRIPKTVWRVIRKLPKLKQVCRALRAGRA